MFPLEIVVLVIHSCSNVKIALCSWAWLAWRSRNKTFWYTPGNIIYRWRIPRTQFAIHRNRFIIRRPVFLAYVGVSGVRNCIRNYCFHPTFSFRKIRLSRRQAINLGFILFIVIALTVFNAAVSSHLACKFSK